MEGIKRFFAVTTTSSIYEVSDIFDENGEPGIKKIAQVRGSKTSRVAVGSALHGGKFVGITRSCGVVLYHQVEGSRPSEVNSFWWGGWTSPIVALFETEEEAKVCANSGDLQGWDPRWQESTMKVLKAVPPADTHFVIDFDLERIYIPVVGA